MARDFSEGSLSFGLTQRDSDGEQVPCAVLNMGDGLELLLVREEGQWFYQRARQNGEEVNPRPELLMMDGGLELFELMWQEYLRTGS